MKQQRKEGVGLQTGGAEATSKSAPDEIKRQEHLSRSSHQGGPLQSKGPGRGRASSLCQAKAGRPVQPGASRHQVIRQGKQWMAKHEGGQQRWARTGRTRPVNLALLQSDLKSLHCPTCSITVWNREVIHRLHPASTIIVKTRMSVVALVQD